MKAFLISNSRLLPCLSLFMLLTACGRTTVIEEKAELLPRVQAQTELTCAASDLSRCAIPSPLQDLADDYFSQSTTPDLEQYATILHTGESSLTARIHLIRAATQSIDVQTFVWEGDSVGLFILFELLEAARRGVKVRIIGDNLYTGNNPEGMAALAQAHENFQISLYNPLNQQASMSTANVIKDALTDFATLNHRMHNKLMVFDGRIGITGGRNIADEYFDRSSEFNFIDRDVLVVGDEVRDMQASFNNYWLDPITVEIDQLVDVRQYLFVNGKQQQLSLPDYMTPAEFDITIANAKDSGFIQREYIQRAHRVNDIQFTADRPQKPFVKDMESDIDTTKRIADALQSAEQSVVMQTPYFILSKKAVQFFKERREQYPDIQYTVATNSLATADHYYVYALAYKRKKRNVKQLRFQIHELKPKPADILELIPHYYDLEKGQLPPGEEGGYEFDPDENTELERYETIAIESKGPRISIHAKSMVIDNRIAIIGSHNFDPRGIAINTEVTLTVNDEAFAREVAASIEFSTRPQNSWLIAKRQNVPFLGHVSGFFQSISRMLPVFDLWPFRYTSSFELKQGKRPLPPGHPDFYEHYVEVGQFPGTTLDDEQFKTIMVGAFGSVAEPLM